MNPIISIIVPVYNEESIANTTVRDMYRQLQKSFNNSFEIIFSENGSSDSTLDILRKFSSKHKNIRVVQLPHPDYGLAMKKGFLAARGTYMANVSMDWYDIEFIKKSIPLLEHNDAVIGQKGTSRKDRWSRKRRIISYGYNFLLKILFGLKIKDTHSITVFRTKKIQPIIKKSVMGWSIFPSEIIIRAQRSGLRLAQKGIVIQESRKAKKSIIGRSFRAAQGLIVLRIILWKESF